MKKYLWMSSATVKIGALRVKSCLKTMLCNCNLSWSLSKLFKIFIEAGSVILMHFIWETPQDDTESAILKQKFVNLRAAYRAVD